MSSLDMNGIGIIGSGVRFVTDEAEAEHLIRMADPSYRGGPVSPTTFVNVLNQFDVFLGDLASRVRALENPPTRRWRR